MNFQIWIFLKWKRDNVVQSQRRVQLFAAPWSTALQTSLSFTVSQALFKFMSIESVMSSCHLILCNPLPLLPSIYPSIRVFFFFFPMSWLFTPIGQSIRASASALVPPMNIVDWLVGSACSPRDTQKSSQAPQFKNMYSSMLSLVYGWTLTSVHDYRKDHSFD